MAKHIRSLLITLLLVPAMAGAENRYVTDEFEITLRSGTSTSNSIVRMLRSGETVTLIEDDLASKYSLVETSDNKKGYVLTRFLMPQPAARESLQVLRVKFDRQREQLNQQKDDIALLEQGLSQEKNDNGALKTTLRASEQELTEIRKAAAETLQIMEQNNQLKVTLAELREEEERLIAENAELKDSTQIDWFVRGAGVFLIAFMIGILVTRIRWRKEDSWGSY